MERYRKAAHDHYNATLLGDWKATARTGDELIEAEEGLLHFMMDSLEPAYSLLSDPDRGVRLSAACLLLPRGSLKARFLLHYYSMFWHDELGLIAKFRLKAWSNERR